MKSLLVLLAVFLVNEATIAKEPDLTIHLHFYGGTIDATNMEKQGEDYSISPISTGNDYGVAFPKEATDEEKKAAIDSYRKAYKEINSGNDYGVAFPKDATDEEKKAAIDSYRKAYKEINS